MGRDEKFLFFFFNPWLRLSFDAAFAAIQTARPIIHPNDAFKDQLLQFEKQVNFFFFFFFFCPAIYRVSKLFLFFVAFVDSIRRG